MVPNPSNMTDSPPQEEERMEEGVPIEDAPNQPAKSRLSTVSKKYDIHGSGNLDGVEQAMRDMDTTNKGYISNEKIYDLMQDHIKVKEQVFTFKKIVMA